MELPILYKYSKFDYLPNAIENQKFRWSSIDELNDPFEGRFHIDKNINNSVRVAALSASINNGIKLSQEHLDLLIKDIQNRDPKLSQFHKITNDINDIIRKSSTGFTPDLYRQIETKIWNAAKSSELINNIYSNAIDFKKQARKVVAERYGILSLATPFNHPLMWGHYASDHTGVMYEFDFNVLNKDAYLYTGIKEVKYQKNYPTMPYDVLLGLNGRLFPAYKDEFNKILNLTKQEEWKYEGEYRSIFSKKHLDEKNLAAIPKECIKSITLGCKSDKTKHAEIVALARKHLPQTKIFFNAIDPVAYKLIRTEI